MATTKGRKPAPNVIRLATGMDPPRHAAAELGEVHPAVGAPEKPEWLTPEASAEWDRVVPELVQLRLLSALDLAALVTYTCTFGRLVVVERALARMQAAGVAAGLEEADALTAVLPSGIKREHVLSRMAAELTTLCDRLLGNFGLSPSTRARVRASLSDGAQQALPGFDAGPGRFFR